jgi:hypothetical protein
MPPSISDLKSFYILFREISRNNEINFCKFSFCENFVTSLELAHEDLRCYHLPPWTTEAYILLLGVSTVYTTGSSAAPGLV